MVIKIRFIVLGTCTVTDFHSFYDLWVLGHYVMTAYSWGLLLLLSLASHLSFAKKNFKNDITFSGNWPHLKGLDQPSHYTVHSFHLLTPARNEKKFSPEFSLK